MIDLKTEEKEQIVLEEITTTFLWNLGEEPKLELYARIVATLTLIMYFIAILAAQFYLKMFS